MPLARRAHLVGHSMGGMIVQEMAAVAPNVSRSIALSCTFSRGREAVTPSLVMLRLGMLSQVGTGVPGPGRWRAWCRPPT